MEEKKRPLQIRQNGSLRKLELFLREVLGGENRSALTSI